MRTEDEMLQGLLAGAVQMLVITGIWIKYDIVSLKKGGGKQRLALTVMGVLTVLLNTLLFCREYRVNTVINIMAVHTIMAVLAGIDLKRKVIPNIILAVGFAVRVLLLVHEWIAYPETIQASLLNMTAGFFFGLIFLLLLSFVTRHGIGYGDVKMFAWLGFSVGLSDTYNILFYSVLAAAAAVYLLLIKKADRKKELPFAPFVYAGCYLVFGLTFLQGLG